MKKRVRYFIANFLDIILLEFSTVQKVDSKKMYDAYNKWPEIAQEAYNSAFKSEKFENINHVVFVGMGGSGILGDIFASILSKTNIHVTIVKGYQLPKTVNSDTLVVVTSISGNTIEPLIVLKKVINVECKIIVFSSGGRLQKYAEENNICFKKIPFMHSPRASLPSFLFSMLKILEELIPIKKSEIEESIMKLKENKKIISTDNLNDSNLALNIAKNLYGIPLIYYPFGLQAVALRFKNSLQENAKRHAMIEDVIESCHNGIVAWEKNSNVQPILLQGTDDHLKTKERWNVLKEFFQNQTIKFLEVFSEEGNILTKLINLIYILDFVSIYLAIIEDIDPSPVNSIDFIKKRLEM